MFAVYYFSYTCKRNTRMEKKRPDSFINNWNKNWLFQVGPVGSKSITQNAITIRTKTSVWQHMVDHGPQLRNPLENAKWIIWNDKKRPLSNPPPVWKLFFSRGQVWMYRSVSLRWFKIYPRPKNRQHSVSNRPADLSTKLFFITPWGRNSSKWEILNNDDFSLKTILRNHFIKIARHLF